MQNINKSTRYPTGYYTSNASSSSSASANHTQNNSKADPAAVDSTASELAQIQTLVVKHLKVPFFTGDLESAISLARQKLERAQEDGNDIDTLYFLCTLFELIFEKKINAKDPYQLFSFLSVDQMNRIGSALRHGNSKASYLILSWAVKKKSSQAMYTISELHEKGIGGAQESRELAFSFCKAAADSKNAPVYTRAYARLAKFYEMGYGTASDMKEAMKYYHLAEETGDIESCFRLATYYRDTGLSLEEGDQKQDFLNKGVCYLEKAVKAGLPKAIAYQGNLLRIHPDTAESGLEMVKEAARMGDSQAQLDMGFHYYNGLEGRESRHLSIAYFQQCLQTGQREKAAAILGKIYSEGELVSKNLDEAISYFRQAVHLKDHSPYWKDLVLALMEQDPLKEIASFHPRELVEIYLMYREDQGNLWIKARDAVQRLIGQTTYFRWYANQNIIDPDQMTADLEKYRENSTFLISINKTNLSIVDRIVAVMKNNVGQFILKMATVHSNLSIIHNEFYSRLTLSEIGSDEDSILSLTRCREKLSELYCNAKEMLVEINEEFKKEQENIEQSASMIQSFIMSQEEWEKIGMDEARRRYALLQQEESKIDTSISSLEGLDKSLDRVLENLSLKGNEVIAAFQREQTKLVERRQKKEEAYAILHKREEEVASELLESQNELRRCLESAQSELASVDPLSDDHDLKIQEIATKYQTALNGFSVDALKEKMASKKQEHLIKMKEMQQRLESSEANLMEMRSGKYAEASASSRADREEIDRLKKGLHEAKKVAAQATQQAARQTEQQRKAHHDELEKQKQTADALRRELENLRLIVQSIPVTTSIEILQNRISQRISDLKEKGIRAYREYNLNSFPPRAYNLEGLEAILLGIGFKRQGDANGSHRHYERQTESIGLSPHNSEEADKAQIQQVLNFLLADLNKLV